MKRILATGAGSITALLTVIHAQAFQQPQPAAPEAARPAAPAEAKPEAAAPKPGAAPSVSMRSRLTSSRP